MVGTLLVALICEVRSAELRGAIEASWWMKTK
jgi:hypothetical protein